MKKRVLVVGGVAGGASCAARLRRLDESAEIVVFDPLCRLALKWRNRPFEIEEGRRRRAQAVNIGRQDEDSRWLMPVMLQNTSRSLP